jgi:hypothetical protein
MTFSSNAFELWLKALKRRCIKFFLLLQAVFMRQCDIVFLAEGNVFGPT